MTSGAALSATHLERAAYVYIRQSSEFQVHNNVERQRLQYALVDYARELGFREIEVIDEDLGISADGVHRPGFEALLEAVCKEQVGLVLSIEASRLSRNGREWHTLLDFCAIVGCMVGDRDRLYDPALIDDRMYLGLKGQFNEMELALFRQRSQESRMAMAARGELFSSVAAGYGKVDRTRIEMTPDQRQRDAIRLVFRKFRDLGSIRQVFLWFRRNAVEIPVRTPGEGLVWKVPRNPGPFNQILSNPVYAGAYVYGRSRQKAHIDNGRKRVRRGIVKRDPDAWTVLLHNHHEGYITWQEYERNQELISENMTTVRGAVRNGPELLAGLLRCGHCDRRIAVRTNGTAIVYRCQGLQDSDRSTCISFGAVRVDAAVGDAAMQVLQPLGMEAALAALAERNRKDDAEIRLAASALAEARYEAERAEAQFNAVEPANANVFHNLARKWEGCLARVKASEARLQATVGERRLQGELSSVERDAYLGLGAELQRVWHHDGISPQLRKRILRTVLVEIIATIKEHEIHLLLHWKGGDHTPLVVPRNQPGRNRWAADAGTAALIRDLARYLPDGSIAALLNRLGRKTGKGNSWSKMRVCAFRSTHGIAIYRDGERQDRGELILSEAAEQLAVDPVVLRRLISSGALPARQACKGAPWIIRREALRSPDVLDQVSPGRPLTPNPNQTILDFQ